MCVFVLILILAPYTHITIVKLYHYELCIACSLKLLLSYVLCLRIAWFLKIVCLFCDWPYNLNVLVSRNCMFCLTERLNCYNVIYVLLVKHPCSSIWPVSRIVSVILKLHQQSSLNSSNYFYLLIILLAIHEISRKHYL